MSDWTWPSGKTGEATETLRALGPSMAVHAETELVLSLQAGSQEAFSWLVSHYHAAVFNLVYGMLGNSGDAADVTQEVFLKVFRGIRNFRQGSSLKTWLYRIAVREGLNRRRWCWRHLRGQFSITEEPDARTAVIRLEGDEKSPLEELESREVQSVVRNALALVPPVFRGAVILRDLEGLGYEEVAEILEISVGTVKSRILRGRRALREVLGPYFQAASRQAPHRRSQAQVPAPGDSRTTARMNHSPSLTTPARWAGGSQ
jgi:RNA polymerase sigma-70 factor (ECF subfamily)